MPFRIHTTHPSGRHSNAAALGAVPEPQFSGCTESVTEEHCFKEGFPGKEEETWGQGRLLQAARPVRLPQIA